MRRLNGDVLLAEYGSFVAFRLFQSKKDAREEEFDDFSDF